MERRVKFSKNRPTRIFGIPSKGDIVWDKSSSDKLHCIAIQETVSGRRFFILQSKKRQRVIVPETSFEQGYLWVIGKTNENLFIE